MQNHVDELDTFISETRKELAGLEEECKNLISSSEKGYQSQQNQLKAVLKSVKEELKSKTKHRPKQKRRNQRQMNDGKENCSDIDLKFFPGIHGKTKKVLFSIIVLHLNNQYQFIH